MRATGRNDSEQLRLVAQLLRTTGLKPDKPAAKPRLSYAERRAAEIAAAKAAQGSGEADQSGDTETAAISNQRMGGPSAQAGAARSILSDTTASQQYNLVLAGRAKKNFKSADLILAGLYRLECRESPQGSDVLLVDLAKRIVGFKRAIVAFTASEDSFTLPQD